MLKMMISWITLLFSLPIWGEESSYLEGISILGEKRIAYIALPGGKISVTEGDEITIKEGKAKGTWQVVLIKQDSVLFKTQAGSTAELRLDHRLPLPTSTESIAAPSAKPLVANEGESTEKDIPLVTSPGTADEEVFKEEVTTEKEIPPLTLQEAAVPDKEPNTQPSSPPKSTTATVPPPEQEEIPPGHQLVKTPFGTFMINSKEK